MLTEEAKEKIRESTDANIQRLIAAAPVVRRERLAHARMDTGVHGEFPALSFKNSLEHLNHDLETVHAALQAYSDVVKLHQNPESKPRVAALINLLEAIDRVNRFQFTI